jgi:hypothetical protein
VTKKIATASSSSSDRTELRTIRATPVSSKRRRLQQQQQQRQLEQQHQQQQQRLERRRHRQRQQQQQLGSRPAEADRLRGKGRERSIDRQMYKRKWFAALARRIAPSFYARPVWSVLKRLSDVEMVHSYVIISSFITDFVAGEGKRFPAKRERHFKY